MAGFVQTTIPIIKFSRINSSGIMTPVYSFDGHKPNTKGANIVSYNFSKSVNELSGDFSIVIKDDEDGNFIDSIQPLDVVTINESHILENDIDFYGVVTRVSFSAMANGFQRQISISGKSIDYLFEYLTISEDVTAMGLAGKNLNAEVENVKLKLAIIDSNNSSVEKKYKPGHIVEVANTVFDTFSNIAQNKVSELSNTDVINIINYFYKDEKFTSTTKDLTFKYPISNNMFGGGNEVNIYNYLRNLLPQNVYEIFGTIIDGQPKIMIREVPFEKEDWSKLNNKYFIDPSTLVNYTVTKSIDEVYTAFYSYLSNSPFSMEWYQRTGVNTNGSPTNVIAADKRKKYGFKLLSTNFVGFTETNLNLEDVFKELNQKLCHFYSCLDEMYDATITVVTRAGVNYKDIPHIGDKVNFLGGEFYVTGEEHTWNYGSSGKTTYHCERGGIYDSTRDWESGFFKGIPAITKRLKELEK